MRPQFNTARDSPVQEQLERFVGRAPRLWRRPIFWLPPARCQTAKRAIGRNTALTHADLRIFRCRRAFARHVISARCAFAYVRGRCPFGSRRLTVRLVRRFAAAQYAHRASPLVFVLPDSLALSHSTVLTEAICTATTGRFRSAPPRAGRGSYAHPSSARADGRRRSPGKRSARPPRRMPCLYRALQAAFGRLCRYSGRLAVIPRIVCALPWPAFKPSSMPTKTCQARTISKPDDKHASVETPDQTRRNPRPSDAPGPSLRAES